MNDGGGGDVLALNPLETRSRPVNSSIRSSHRSQFSASVEYEATVGRHDGNRVVADCAPIWNHNDKLRLLARREVCVSLAQRIVAPLGESRREHEYEVSDGAIVL